ncbi:hypothetical protein DL98DRAFT_576647 [Cadophora sp. DSE1049]|nr:hypothetical protein DL98DRAFT_576647 [Cadophora sp. DSE1049]
MTMSQKLDSPDQFSLTSFDRNELSTLSLKSTSSSTTSASPTYFPLAKLPREVRDKIFLDELALGPLKQVPPLLIALGCSKEWRVDYYEAQRMYFQQNYMVSVKNQEKFKYMDRKRRMAIRYLRFEVLQASTTPTRCLSLRNSRAFCLNDFETLTIDLTGLKELETSHGKDLRDFFCAVDYMRKASRRGVRMMYVIMDPGAMRGITWPLASLGKNYQSKGVGTMDGRPVELFEWQGNI